MHVHACMCIYSICTLLDHVTPTQVRKHLMFLLLRIRMQRCVISMITTTTRCIGTSTFVTTIPFGTISATTKISISVIATCIEWEVCMCCSPCMCMCVYNTPYNTCVHDATCMCMLWHVIQV